ncbi:MAG: DUF58 domain-containing protein [Planctomycetota bacterium]
MPDLMDYLKPEIISKVDNLELIAKFIVEGFLIGLHKSPYHGFSVEFSSYRKYAPGDELKFVDWRVFARTDKFYVKQFEETTNLNCFITMDLSASMNFADVDRGVGANVTKFAYSSYLAAALAYMMLQQNDSVSLVGFSTDRFEFLPPSGKSNRLVQFLTVLDKFVPSGETDMGRGLSLLAERIKGRSLVIILSDLLVEPRELTDALQYFRYKNHEVIIYHILTNTELTFPFMRQTNFRDIETGRELVTESGYIRDDYIALLEKHTRDIKDACEEMEVDFVPLSTSDELGGALMNYLSRRMMYY